VAAAGRLYLSAGTWNFTCPAGQRACPSAGLHASYNPDFKQQLSAQIDLALAQLPGLCGAASSECHVGTLISSPQLRALAQEDNARIRVGVPLANSHTLSSTYSGRALLGLVDNEGLVNARRHGPMGVQQDMAMNTWLYQQLLSLLCPPSAQGSRPECTEVIRFGRACRCKREQGEGWTAAWRRRCEFRVQFKGHDELLAPGPNEGRCSCDANGGSALAL
jgi:hypothetical protein